MDNSETPHPAPSAVGAAIRQWLESDHTRLDKLLRESLQEDNTINRERYDEFRRGLLRHINIEEKILFPAASKIGVLELASKLRVDHGAIAAVLVLEPTRIVRRALMTILAAHNPLEEGETGVYERCVELVGDSAGRIFADLEQSPQVPLATRAQSAQLVEAAKRCLERAGFEPSLLDG